MTARSPAAVAAPLTWRVAGRPPLAVVLGLAAAGGVLLAVAPVFPVAAARDGASTAPAVTSGPLLAVLGLAPAALAVLLAARGRPSWALGVLAGVAALAPGRVLLDLQLLAAPWRAARPELLVPTSLAALRPGAAVWLLLLGHLAVAAAGLLGVLAASGAAAAPAAALWTTAGRPAGGSLAAALCGGVLAAAGLVAAPLRSSDPYLLPRGAIDGPGLVTLGLLALAAGVVVAACVAAAAADQAVGRGALVGVALGVLAVALPPVYATVLAPELTPTWGPAAALAGAAGLAVLAWLLGRERAAADPGELRLPALDRLHTVSGGLAALAGLAALLAAALPQVSVPAGAHRPVLYPVRLLVPAGLLLAALGGAVLLGGARPSGARPSGAGRRGTRRRGAPGVEPARWTAWPAALRPALAVAWAAVALAGMAALDAALTAIPLAGVGAGAGLWATALALLAATAAASVAAVAGGVERDEADLTELRAAPPVAAAGVLAAALTVPAFGLPLRAAPGYAEPGLWSDFQLASWGLLAAAATVAVAALLAPWSRPSRAVALLLGAAAVVAVRLAQLPLSSGRAGPGATVAGGAWFGLACLGALLAAALLAGVLLAGALPVGPAGRRPRSTLRGGAQQARREEA